MGAKHPECVNEIIRQYMFRATVMRNGAWVRMGLVRESEVKHENFYTDFENEFMVTREEGRRRG